MNDIELIDEIVRRADEHQKQKEKEFAIAELEKIKTGVHDIRLEIDCDMHTGDKVIQLIDKRISELKGE